MFGRPALFIIRWQMASLPRRLPVRDGNRWLQRKFVNVCSFCPVLGSQRAFSCCPICQERYIGPEWNHGKYKYFVFETDDESITIASLPILFLDRLQVTMNTELAWYVPFLFRQSTSYRACMCWWMVHRSSCRTTIENLVFSGRGEKWLVWLNKTVFRTWKEHFHLNSDTLAKQKSISTMYPCLFCDLLTVIADDHSTW